MKILSVIVPAYNTELYISRCLDSLTYNLKLLKDLEIIVVDDGSKDDTAAVVRRYCKRFPNTVKLIQKENGGHGSTINAGIRIASGKYLKIIDADDWINITDFENFIEQLKKEESDIVITGYRQDILYNEKEIIFSFNKRGYGEIKKISSIEKIIDDEDFFFEFSMHAITIKTKKIKDNWGDGLLEKTFFVDQQYVAKILECSETFIVYDLDIYRYFIGRPEQSVSSEGYFKHRKDHERVLRWLLNKYKTSKDEIYRKIIYRQTSLMIKTQYDNYLSRKKLTKSEKKELLEFDKFLRKEFMEFRSYKRLRLKLSRIYKTHTMRIIALVRRKI